MVQLVYLYISEYKNELRKTLHKARIIAKLFRTSKKAQVLFWKRNMTYSIINHYNIRTGVTSSQVMQGKPDNQRICQTHRNIYYYRLSDISFIVAPKNTYLINCFSYISLSLSLSLSTSSPAWSTFHRLNLSIRSTKYAVFFAFWMNRCRKSSLADGLWNQNILHMYESKQAKPLFQVFSQSKFWQHARTHTHTI